MYALTNTQPKSRGFVALTSAIIISVSLLIFVTAIGFEGYFSRFSVLESNFKERSTYLAEACAQTAYLKLTQDSEYNDHPETVVVGDENCTIVDVEDGTFPDEFIISAQGTSSRAYTNLQVEVDVSDPEDAKILSWEEVPRF